MTTKLEITDADRKQFFDAQPNNQSIHLFLENIALNRINGELIAKYEPTPEVVEPVERVEGTPPRLA